MGAIVDPLQLVAYLHRPVREDSAREAIRVAEGWLWGALPTTWTAWPSPIPPDLAAAALELAAIVYTNPTGLASETTDDDTRVYVMASKAQILDRVTKRYPAANEPRFHFPPAPTWPVGA